MKIATVIKNCEIRDKKLKPGQKYVFDIECNAYYELRGYLQALRGTKSLTEIKYIPAFIIDRGNEFEIISTDMQTKTSYYCNHKHSVLKY